MKTYVNFYRYLAIMALYLITFMTLYGFVMTSNFTGDTSTKNSISTTKKLWDTLMKDYNKNILPVNDLDKSYRITVTPYLIAIGDLDEVEEKLSSVVDFHYRWTDENMVWNSSDHNGITNVTMDSSLVWKPALKIQNMHHKTRSAAKYEDNVYYLEDGKATWFQTQVLDTTCSLDTTYFPFDIQTCTLTFMITGFHAYAIAVDVTAENEHLTFFDHNGAWRLHNYTIEGRPFALLFITYILHRKPLFIIVNVLLPIIVLAFLTPLVFLLSKGSGERLGYTVTILLAISVYMTMLSDSLPANSDPMPHLSYLLLMLYLITGVIFLMVIVNAKVFNAKCTKPVPMFAKRLVTFTRCISSYENKKKNIFEAAQVQEEQEGCLQKNGQSEEIEMTRDGRDICWSEVSNAMDLICFVTMFGIILTMISLFFVTAYRSHGTLSLEA